MKRRRRIVESDGGNLRRVPPGIKDGVSLAPPEQEVLRVMGEESKQNGTNRVGSRQINRIIRAARNSKCR